MAFWGNSGKPKKFLCTISLKKSSSECPNTPRWIIQSINFVNMQQNRHYSANEPPKSQVKGKIAIITGGARGIGLSIAEQLLKEEAEAVILGDILIQEMENATFSLNEKYGEHKALFQPTDVSKTKQMEKLFKCTKDRFGRVDILINNAGILNNQNIEETININIKGLVRGTFLAFQYMTGKGGVIINNAGLEGLQPLYASPIYCGTNHFAIGFSRSMGHEYFYKNTNVKVMAFCPGPTQTEFLRNSGKNGDDPLFPNLGQHLEKFFNQQPIQQPKSVAKGIISMLNDGENGSIWISKECKFYKIKVPGLDKLKPVSITSKAQSMNKLPCPSGTKKSDKTGKCAECKSEKMLKVQSNKTKTVKSDKTGKCKQCKSDQKVKQTKKSKSDAAVRTKSEQKSKSSKSKMKAEKDKGVCKKSDKTGKCARSKSEQNLKTSKNKPKKASKTKSETALSTAAGKDKGICLRSDKTGKCSKCKSEQKVKSSTSKAHTTKKSRSESRVDKTTRKDKGVCLKSDKTGKCTKCKSEQKENSSTSKTHTTKKSRSESRVNKTAGKDKGICPKSDKTGKCAKCKSEQKEKSSTSKTNMTKKSKSESRVNNTAGKDKGICLKSDKTGKGAKCKSEQKEKSSTNQTHPTKKSKSESRVKKTAGKDKGICLKSDKTGKCAKCKSEQKEKSSTSQTHTTKKNRSESKVNKSEGKDKGICLKSDKTGKCAKCKSEQTEKSGGRKSQPIEKSKPETGTKKLDGKDQGIHIKSDKTGKSTKLKSEPKENFGIRKTQPTKKIKSESEVNKASGKDKGICPKSEKTGKCAKCKSEPKLHSSKGKPQKTSGNKKGAATTISTEKDNSIGLRKSKTEEFLKPQSEQRLQLGKDKPHKIVRSKSEPRITTSIPKDKGVELKKIKMDRSGETKSATSKQASDHQIKSKKSPKCNENKDIIKTDKPTERKSTILKIVVNAQPIPLKQTGKTSEHPVKLIESKKQSKTDKNQDKSVKLNKSEEIKSAISNTVNIRQPNIVKQVNKTTKQQIKLNESRPNKNQDTQINNSRQAANDKQMDYINAVFNKSASLTPGKQASKISEPKIKLKENKKSSETNKSQDMKIDFSQRETNDKQIDLINSVFNKSAGPLQILSSDKKQEKQKIASKPPKNSGTVPPSSPKPKRKNSSEKKCGDRQDKPSQTREEKIDPCRKKEHWRKKVPCNYFKPPCDKPKPKKQEKKKEKPVCEDIKAVPRPKETGLILKEDPCKKKGPCYSTKKTRQRKQKNRKENANKTKKEKGSKVKKVESKKPAENSAGSSSTKQANEPILKPIRTILPTADNRPLDCDLPKSAKSSKKKDSHTKKNVKCGKLNSKAQSSSESKSKSVSEITSFEKDDTKSKITERDSPIKIIIETNPKLAKDLKKSVSMPLKLDSNATKDNKNLAFEEKQIKKKETYDAKSKNIIENLDSLAKPVKKEESIGTKDFKAAEGSVKLDLEIKSIKKEDYGDTKTCSEVEGTEKLIKPIIKASSEMNLPKNVMDTLRTTDVDELETFIIVRPSKKIKPGTKSNTMVSLFKEDGKKTVWVPEPSDTFVLKITSKSKPKKSSTKMGSDFKNNSNKKMFCSKSDEKKGGKRPTPCNDPKFPKKFACPRVKFCPPKPAADEKKEVADIYKLKLERLRERAKKLGEARKVEKTRKEEVSTKKNCEDKMNCKK